MVISLESLRTSLPFTPEPKSIAINSSFFSAFAPLALSFSRGLSKLFS